MARASSETRGAAMVMGAVLSVQCGAALATTLFDDVGPGGAVLLRSAFAALALLAVSRRTGGGLGGRPHRDVVLFGFALAGMNLAFYGALDRIPLGIAVTLEFVGPLGVAVLESRQRRDLVWAALAAGGIVLLAGGAGGGGIDALGALMALFAGGCWGAYILLSARVGQRYAGLGGLALAMAISAVLVAPFGLAQGGLALLAVSTLAVGLAVGMLSSAIPYGLELEALRRLPNAVFGVLMSIEPAVAALVGFVALSQGLALREALGIALVVVASAGALSSATAPAPQEV